MTIIEEYNEWCADLNYSSDSVINTINFLESRGYLHTGPKIEEIKKLNLKEGDILIVKIKGEMNTQNRMSIRKSWINVLRDEGITNQVVVLDKQMDLKTMTPEEVKEQLNE